MKTQHSFTVAVAVLLLTPVVLSVGTFFAIPLILLTLAVLPAMAALAVSALIASAMRTPAPTMARAQARSLPRLAAPGSATIR